MITVSQFMLIIWGFFLFCSSEASDPHLAVIAGDLGNATDWIQQEKAYGTPMHVKNSYESANILHMHVPQQTKIAYWKVRVNESHTICPARNVSLLLQHGSYPVTSIDGGKFPENFYFPLVTTYTLQSLSDSSLHWVNVTNPIPGHWYILAYLNSEDDRITQKDLAVKCLATVYIEGEYHVTNDVIIILPQVHDYQDIKLYQSVTGSQLYKFYVPSDTWRVRVNITKCLRVVHPDSDTSAEDMRGCSLLLSVSPAAFPNILRNNTMWKNCSEEAGDEGSCTLDFTPKEDAWHYLSVSAYGSTVSFALSVGYHSCSYEALEQQYMVMTELLPSHICASLLKSQNVNLDARTQGRKVIGCLSQMVWSDYNTLLGSTACGSGFIQVNNTNPSEYLHVPYPLPGLWYLSLFALCYPFNISSSSEPCEDDKSFKVLVSLINAPCVLGSCGQHGKCYTYFSGMHLFSSCRCFLGYTGWDCSDDSKAMQDYELLLSTLLLTLSNIMFIPALLVSLYRHLYPEALVYFFTMFFSTFYHACDQSSTYYFCLMKYDVLQFCDFYSGLLALWVTVIAMADLPFTLYSSLHLLGAIGLALGVQYDRQGLWVFLIPFLSAFFILTVSWVAHCRSKRSCFPKKPYWYSGLLPGILFFAVGLTMYAFLQTNDNYKFVHSAWHMCIALAICFLVPRSKGFIIDEGTNQSESKQMYEEQAVGAMSPPAQLRLFPALTLRGFGSTENEERLQKIIHMEFSLWQETGEKVPQSLTPEQWKNLYNLPSRAGRKKYLLYLFKVEKAKEKQVIKKEEAAQLREVYLAQRREERAKNPHIIYGLAKNTILLKVYDKTMDMFHNYKVFNAMLWGQSIVFDLSYDSYMNQRECLNCADQIQMALAANRRHADPFHVQLCHVDAQSPTYRALEKFIPTIREPTYPLSIHEHSYLNLYPKDKLVYLTPHCREEIKEVDDDVTYIIGAIVDKSGGDPISLAKAKRLGIRMQKLPLDTYLNWGMGHKTLTLNQVMEILLDAKHYKDWKYALRHVPKRKLIKFQNLQPKYPVPAVLQKGTLKAEAINEKVWQGRVQRFDRQS
ncbi:unnamed protein product [Darwinula stevensoni]|uniref:tRNA methyltransferase 10 homolog C n=1 Tax=Darwinula stevensoni TaxID=69355 RepID=A0A7R8X6Z0_9CRUS|nr:unnamed protein product [Darwinula stevensoni]CAG0886422.1 unnamed protein product [Darwinula stevensoni]